MYSYNDFLPTLKVRSGCSRFIPEDTLRQSFLSTTASEVKSGDLILCKVVSDLGVYTSVENEHGMPVTLHLNDYFIGVVATRFSGTNVNGSVPLGELSVGSELYLLAQGGIIGDYKHEHELQSKPLRLELAGFLIEERSKCILNTNQYPAVNRIGRIDLKKVKQPVVLVSGTSAESGKTTFVTNFNLALKKKFPGKKTAAIKVCGTGRMRDYLDYCNANYNYSLDFVHCGLPTTYGIDDADVVGVMHSLINDVKVSADVIVIEIGGDILEASAPAIIESLSALPNLSVTLLVNDAMGARDGIRSYKKIGMKPKRIVSYKQYLPALADRLGVERDYVIHPRDKDSLEVFASEVLVL